MIDDISPPTDLNPKAKYFEEVGDTCINVDGAIEITRKTNTPAAKAVWYAFRKKLVEVVKEKPELEPEKQREEAFFKALDSLGFKTRMTHVKGTMD